MQEKLGALKDIPVNSSVNVQFIFYYFKSHFVFRNITLFLTMVLVKRFQVLKKII